MRAKFLTGAAFVMSLMMALYVNAAPSNIREELVIGVAQFPSSLHPNIDAEVIKTYTLAFATRPITAYDSQWQNRCHLCSKLPTTENALATIVDLDNGGKGMAVTIKLRPDLKWGDGTPVTTRDLEFTWRVARDPKSGFSNPHPWTRATKIQVIDQTTAILHLDRVLSSYNEWDQLLPAHIEEPVFAIASLTGAYAKQTTYNRAPTTSGLYNGPYLVTGYESGSQIVLEPNPFWAGGKPWFKRITIKLISNTAALQANLLSSDVDMVAGEVVGLTIDQVLELQKQKPTSFLYIFKPSLTYEHIDVKKENPVLQDVRTRKALLYAADRKTMTEELFQGLQPVADTWVNPLNPNHTPAVQTYPYNLARARELLAQAGWKPGSDGVCVNVKGERLAVEFSTTAGNRLREAQQQILQGNWRLACIETRIKNELARTFFGDTLKRRTYSGLAMYSWTSGVSESPRRTLGSDNIPMESNGFGGANFTAFANPRMDQLIAQAESELNPDARREIWAEMQAIYANELPALPLFFRAEPHVVPVWLRGYEPTGHLDVSSLAAEHWRRGD